MAENEYEKYNQQEINIFESDFDKEIKKIQAVNPKRNTINKKNKR
jgi:hypothetical protein